MALEPLRPHHGADLLRAAQDPDIWRWMPADLRTTAAMTRFLADAREREARGTDYSFAVILLSDGRAAGSTRYLEVDEANRGVEIGWTWYRRDLWGTRVNPEAKLLLLRHAFEAWGALRVQFKLDALNSRSEAAVRKLGASWEGRLRHHRIRPDGTLRDSLVFSILAGEWPPIREGLAARIAGEPGTKGIDAG